VLVEKSQEALLEPAEGDTHVSVDDASELARPATVRPPVENGLDLLGVSP
jgi:hypothetical protein